MKKITFTFAMIALFSISFVSNLFASNGNQPKDTLITLNVKNSPQGEWTEGNGVYVFVNEFQIKGQEENAFGFIPAHVETASGQLVAVWLQQENATLRVVDPEGQSFNKKVAKIYIGDMSQNQVLAQK